jgi:hypothetical protein
MGMVLRNKNAVVDSISAQPVLHPGDDPGGLSASGAGVGDQCDGHGHKIVFGTKKEEVVSGRRCTITIIDEPWQPRKDQLRRYPDQHRYDHCIGMRSTILDNTRFLIYFALDSKDGAYFFRKQAKGDSRATGRAESTD